MHLTELPLELIALTTQKPAFASLRNQSGNHWYKIEMLFAVNKATGVKSYSGRDLAKQIHRRLDVDSTTMGNDFRPQSLTNLSVNNENVSGDHSLATESEDPTSPRIPLKHISAPAKANEK